MRFCFVMLPFEYYSPVSGGAIATVTMNVIRELEKNGHEAFVLAHDDAQPIYPTGGVRLLPVKPNSLMGGVISHLQARLCGWDWQNQGRFWKSVHRELRSLSPDVVVLSNDLVGAINVRAALPGVKIAVWVHNECHSSGDIPSGLAATDVFLGCSHYIENWLLGRYSLPRDKVHVAYAGVDTDIFFPAKTERLQHLRLLYTGRLDPNKGVDVAVEVFRRLKKGNFPVSLTVAGHSWFYNRETRREEAFLKNLRKVMTESAVDWLGHVPRRWLPGVMRGHDIALVLSRSREPFGLVVLEAMASGLAVMASPYGGLRESCGEAGIFVDPGNPVEITKKLESLYEPTGELALWKGRSLERVM
ncbi:MAG: glycosyltransferase family 4 protein, partial [Pseudomonadota bacterium]